MKLFNRTISNTTPTNTVKDYYQTEQREHKVVAWLLAFVTFIVTLAVILLLFFAGRWAYQKITKNDSSETPVATQPQANPTPTETPSDDSDAQTNAAQTSNDNTPPQTSSARTTTPSAVRQPNTGPSDELVRTGPDLDL